MTKLDLAKMVTKFVVGSGTSIIVGSIIKNNVRPENAYQTVAVCAGSIALGSMVADLTSRYTEAKIDAVAAWYDENVKK